MSTFICPLCSITREFSTFLLYFRHITLFHQNETQFAITCNLHNKCGVLYRTFSAYKSHIYRHHYSELQVKTNFNTSKNVIVDETETDDNDLNVDVDLIYDDRDELYNFDSPTKLLDISKDNIEKLDSNLNHEKLTTTFDIKRSYASFILQLREEFLVSKNTTNAILSYITTLMNHLQDLFEQQAFNCCSHSTSSSSSNTHIKVVKLEALTTIIDDVSKSIEATTRNEYQFLKNCEDYLVTKHLKK